MKPKEFVEITKNLLPKIDVNTSYSAEYVAQNNRNFISVKETVLSVEDIFFISENCFYESFSVGFFYFIEAKEIFGYIILGQLESSYILCSKESGIIYQIGYETIDEFFYGDGDIPTFETIIPVAVDYSHFLDALALRLELQKQVVEKKIAYRNYGNVEPFTEKAIIAAGGKNYRIEMFF